MKKEIEVKGTKVQIKQFKGEDYISLTDIAKSQGVNIRPADLIKNWIRTRTTIEFIGTWEKLNNPEFKVVEFDHFKTQAGLPTFGLSRDFGKKKQMLSGLLLFKENMVAHTHIKTLLLNFVLQLTQFSNYF